MLQEDRSPGTLLMITGLRVLVQLLFFVKSPYCIAGKIIIVTL